MKRTRMLETLTDDQTMNATICSCFLLYELLVSKFDRRWS